MIGPLAEGVEGLREAGHSPGQRQAMGLRLTVVYLEMLRGAQGRRGLASWVQEQRWGLGRALKGKHCRLPSDGTIRRAVEAVTVDEHEAGIGGWAQEAVPALTGETWSGVALDGKTLRGSGRPEQSARQLLRAFRHELGVVLGHRAVAGKTNPIPELPGLLEQLT